MAHGSFGFVESADGTTIGYEAFGCGPRLIMVHGGTADRSRWVTVAPLLARDFEVWLVDRRGRGLSGDAADGGYGLEREADDLVALAEAAGPGAAVVAHSAGATIAMLAAPRLTSLASVVLYEPAFATPGNPIVDAVTFAAVEQRLDAGEREEALLAFLRNVMHMPSTAIDAMRGTPVWEARLAAAHTFTREGRALGDYQPDVVTLAELPYPVLVLSGTESPGWLRSAAAAAHRAIAGSRYVDLVGQAHAAMDTAPEAFAHQVVAFATERASVPPGTPS